MQFRSLSILGAASLFATAALGIPVVPKTTVNGSSSDARPPGLKLSPATTVGESKDACIAILQGILERSVDGVSGTASVRAADPQLPPPITAPALEGPVVVADRIGYLGGKRDNFEKRMDKIFGEGNWEIRHRVGDKIITRAEALQLYEDGYYEYFKNHPEVAEKLAKEASDVYDTDVSNLGSGFDYEKQETPHQHLQDIAIRRSMARLGYRFEGTKPLQVRGHDSPLYHLNPGKVPFHRPDIISQKRIFEADWLNKNSIEDFWQNNKFVVVRGGDAYLKQLHEEVSDLLRRSKSDQYRILQQKLLVLLLSGKAMEAPLALSGTLAKAASFFQKAKHADAAEELAIDYINILDNAQLGVAPESAAALVHTLLRPTTNVESLVSVFDRIQTPEFRAAFGLAAAAQGPPTVGQDWMLSALAHDKAAMAAVAANPKLVAFGREQSLYERARDLRLANPQGESVADRLKLFMRTPKPKDFSGP